MNKVEKALMHALFVHLHHNTDKAIDFGLFKQLNEKVNQTWPSALLVGPDANDDAAVFKLPDREGLVVAKMESHCSPCVTSPYDSAATGAGGAMRDVVAMGARPVFCWISSGHALWKKRLSSVPVALTGNAPVDSVRL